jgi:nucleoside 2-deoxyribosyltransferase
MSVNKIFIACPFIKYINGTTFTDDNFRKFIEKLAVLCRTYVPHVFLALERENYGETPLPNYSCALDFDEMKSSDLVIAIPDNSMGVAVELGWASTMKKTVLLVLDCNKKYSPLIYKLNQITPGRQIWYDEADFSERTLTQIKEELDSMF